MIHLRNYVQRIKLTVTFGETVSTTSDPIEDTTLCGLIIGEVAPNPQFCMASPNDVSDWAVMHNEVPTERMCDACLTVAKLNR